MIPYEDDDDERKDAILQALGGEVDDYAGSQLPDPSKMGPGVTIEISVKPKGQEEAMPKEETEEPESPNMVAGNEEHDPIAHILGLCRGGCAY